MTEERAFLAIGNLRGQFGIAPDRTQKVLEVTVIVPASGMF